MPDNIEALSTAQLLREVNNLREVVETRLNAIDRATNLFQENLTRVPTDTDKQIRHLQELHDEKFFGVKNELQQILSGIQIQLADRTVGSNDRMAGIGKDFTNRLESSISGIQKQFEERDVRSKAAELAAQVAVGAALQAQKEAAGAQNESNSAAITKSESATVKQIDGILALLNSNSNALNDKIAVINGRLDRGEGSEKGSHGSITMIIAVVAVIASVGGVLMSFIPRHNSNNYSQDIIHELQLNREVARNNHIETPVPTTAR